MFDSVKESLLLLVIGMTGVFSSLFVLAGMIWGMRKTDEAINSWRIRTYSKRVEEHKVDPEVNDELIAVIAGAVEIAIRKKAVIRRIRFIDRDIAPSWAVTGRLNIMASHSIQKRKLS